MNTEAEGDLRDLSEVIQDLERQLPKMTLTARIDVAARLKGLDKAIDRIDKSVKAEVKARRKGKAGYVLGDLFKAYLNIFPKTRVDLEMLEVEYPKVYAKCLRTDNEERVTFEVK
jgi:hypothetical protein